MTASYIKSSLAIFLHFLIRVIVVYAVIGFKETSECAVNAHCDSRVNMIVVRPTIIDIYLQVLYVNVC